MQTFTALPQVSRVLGLGDTKSSVLLDSGLQADLRLVTPEQKGAALQYFTGSKGHNIALRDRAIALGLRLNEYGLTRLADGVVVAGASEEDVYAALGLAWVPPELRENRGEVEAAERRALPALITRQDLRGDLHSHTNATDGKEDLETMARAARAAGLEYLAVTDHSQALAMANGLDERRALEQAARIRALNARLDGIRLLAGIECDIRSDGTLDLADDCLAAARLRRRVRAFRIWTRTGRDDRPPAGSHCVPVGRCHRPPDRPSAACGASRSASMWTPCSRRRPQPASPLKSTARSIVSTSATRWPARRAIAGSR